MAGPKQDFNGLSADKHGYVGHLNERVNAGRHQEIEKAIGDTPAASTVSTSRLKAAAETASPGKVEFFTAPDAKREENRRKGPPAHLLKKLEQD